MNKLLPRISKLFEIEARRRPWPITVGSFVVYLLLFVPVFSLLAKATLVLSSIPVFVCAFVFGWRGGVVAGLFVVPMTLSMYWVADRADPHSFTVVNFCTSHVFIIIFGIVVGVLRSLQQTLTSELKERRQIEIEKEALITELNEALEKVKTLKGLLPICTSCKKIKDDQGYWNHLESYIEAHSSASFSHGLCQECADELYQHEPWYKKVKNRN